MRKRPLDAAKREFEEETGFPVMANLWSWASETGGWKDCDAWAFEGDCDPANLRAILSPWSGHRDRTAAGVSGSRPGRLVFASERRTKRLIAGQLPFLDRLGSSV